MGFLDAFFDDGRRSKSVTDDFWYKSAPQTSLAGTEVSDESAMRQATVWGCIRILAESLASLPIHLYRRLPGGGRERATDHWAYDLMHRAPHPQLTAYQFIETLMFHMGLRGNHYSEKTILKTGQIESLTPWNPAETKVSRNTSGMLVYTLETPGANRTVTEAEMFHVPALAWNGLIGLAPITYARETIGEAQAVGEFGARYFRQGTNMGHVFTLPEGALYGSDEVEKFKADLKEKYSELGKSHLSLVTPAGMKVEKVGIPPDDSQFLDTRKFHKAEIASMFRVPLHLLQEHERSTSWGTGIENLDLGFVRHTLRPWAMRIEQCLDRNMLTEDEQRAGDGGLYFEFLFNALQRGDMKTRGGFYAVGIRNGFFTRNEVREWENLNPLDGGDTIMLPLNLAPAPGEPDIPLPEEGQSETPPERQAALPPAGGDAGIGCGPGCEACNEAEAASRAAAPVEHRQDGAGRQNIQRSFRRLISNSMARLVKREKQDVTAAAKKHIRRRSAESLVKWLTEYYEDHVGIIQNEITPVFTALAEAIGDSALREIEAEFEFNDELQEWLDNFILAFAERQANFSRAQLQTLIEETAAEGEDILDALDLRFEEWEDGRLPGALSRADKIAAAQAVRLGQGFSRAAWVAAGVSTFVWVNTGEDTCPYCEGLDGQETGIEDAFLHAGQPFQPSEQDEPLTNNSDVFHPPAHGGCDCVLITG